MFKMNLNVFSLEKIGIEYCATHSQEVVSSNPSGGLICSENKWLKKTENKFRRGRGRPIFNETKRPYRAKENERPKNDLSPTFQAT